MTKVANKPQNKQTKPNKQTPSKYSLMWLSQLSTTNVMTPFLTIYAHCGSQENSEQHAILELLSYVVKTKLLHSTL